MSSTGITSARLPLERKGADFLITPTILRPFRTLAWLLVLAGTAAGFAALGTPLPFEDGILSGWLRAAAFVGLPLLALKIAAPGAGVRSSAAWACVKYC